LTQTCENGVCEVVYLQNNDDIPVWKNSNFLIFLVYISSLMLAVSLSNPFFNLYLLDNLQLPVSLVAIYTSIQMGTTMTVLIFLGRLPDKIGSRPILIAIGVMVGFQPLLCLGIGNTSLDLWLWLPMLHIFLGLTIAASDLCINNLQLEITPVKNRSIYLAIVAAVAGFSGALGTTLGGFMAQFPQFGGLVGLFIVSSICRLGSIAPLLFLKEPQN
jgi:MFS family permease